MIKLVNLSLCIQNKSKNTCSVPFPELVASEVQRRAERQPRVQVGHETEAPVAAPLIWHQVAGRHLAEAAEGVFEVGIGLVVGEVGDENVGREGG